MSVPVKLIDLSLTAFSDTLAARSATPGGGSAAAYAAAVGIGLASMAFRFSTGEKYAAVAAYMSGRAEELDALRARALDLVDRDAGAYDKVSAAYKLPKSTDAEKAERARAIQKALQGALELPLETMETALSGLRLAAAGAKDANRNVGSDLETGASCLRAGLEGGLANVRVNAASIEDKAWVERRLAAAEAMRAEADRLVDLVRAGLRGPS